MRREEITWWLKTGRSDKSWAICERWDQRAVPVVEENINKHAVEEKKLERGRTKRWNQPKGQWYDYINFVITAQRGI